MFWFIAMVIVLVAITYFLGPARAGKSSGWSGGDNPFKGRHTQPPPKPHHGTIDKGQMTRCHNCSCYFPESRVVTDVVEGHILEFCSQNCRQNFLVSGR